MRTTAAHEAVQPGQWRGELRPVDERGDEYEGGWRDDGGGGCGGDGPRYPTGGQVEVCAGDLGEAEKEGNGSRRAVLTVQLAAHLAARL